MNNVKTWDEVSLRIKSMPFDEDFDMIVAIANGGIVPAAIINQRLQLPIELLKVHYRDAKQQPEFPSPKLMEQVKFNVSGKRVLLVEDRVKTGATLTYAKALLQDAAVLKTFAVNGKADYALFDEPCFSFPWIL